MRRHNGFKSLTMYTSSLVMGLLLSGVSMAYDFSNADNLFRKRAEGFSTATLARETYAGAVSSGLSNEDKIYAVSQMSRLDIYRSGMIAGVEGSERRKALEGCIDTVEEIANISKQEYHYYKISCIALRGKHASNILDRGKWAFKMRGAQTAALESTSMNGELKGGFEAGGVLRVMSAVRGNRKAKPLGLYDANEALKFARLALDTESATYPPYPEAMAGTDYYENYYYVAQSQTAVGIENEDVNEIDKASETLNSTLSVLAELEGADSLPKGREPETKYYKSQMEELKANIEACRNERKWRSCLVDKLD